MNLIKSFEKALERKKERGWERIYVFVDIHDTIFPSDYGSGKSYKYYVNAKECLQLLTKRDDVCLGLYTSSYPADIANYLDIFHDGDIMFELIGKNSFEKNTTYACFDVKPYFNVLIDDKGGFIPEEDWGELYEYLQYNRK
jgi:hypothetical protein